MSQASITGGAAPPTPKTETSPACFQNGGSRTSPQPRAARAGRARGTDRPGAAGRMRAARRQDVGAGGLRVPGEAGPGAGAGGPVGGQGLAHHGAEPLPRRLQHTGKRRRTGAM